MLIVSFEHLCIMFRVYLLLFYFGRIADVIGVVLVF